MRWIDEQYLKTPWYGWPRMTAALRRQGYQVNGKRVRRVRQRLGWQARPPRARPATSTPGQRGYPSVLRAGGMDRPNLVGGAARTYVPLGPGLLSLGAVLDWYSRYGVAWQLANTLAGSFCRIAVHQALTRGTPTILNTDQGSQFTRQAFTSLLHAAGVQLRRDGRGRVFDNSFVERLWRTVKAEHL